MKKRIRILAILLSIVATCISAYSIIEGPRIPTGDSMSYLNCAQSIATSQEHSFPYFALSKDGNRNLIYLEKNTIWPPATSVVIALQLKLGISVVNAARNLILFFTFSSVLLCFIFSYKICRSETLSSVITVVFFSMWTFHYWIAVSVMSEGLFITVTLLSSIYLITIFDSSKFRLLNFFLVGLITGSTYYIKSAAPAYILACGLAILLSNVDWSKRLKNSILYGLGACLVILPWLLRNLNLGTVGSQGSGPRSSAIFDSLLCFVRLFIPKHGSFFESKWSIAAFIICLLILIFVLLVGVQQLKSINHNFRNSIKPILENQGIRLSFIYIFCFIAVMIFAMVVLPLASHIESRYWMELYPFVIPTLVMVFRSIKLPNSTKYGKLQYIGLVVITSIIFISNVIEIQKNRKKSWIILQSDKSRLTERIKLSESLQLDGPAIFSSNHRVKFEVKTGLTSWSVDNPQYPNSQLAHYYVVYPVDPNSMNLTPISNSLPDKYIYINESEGVKYYKIR